MGSGNWIIDNIANALEVWNAKLAEIWGLLVQTPENFKGGAVWDVITDIHGALQAVGYALLVLFFSIVIPLIYLPNFNIEYDYRVAGGELNIAAVKNRRIRKELASIRLAGAEFIAPYNGSFRETADRAECDGVIDASSSESSPDRWFAIYPDPDGGQKRYLIFFDASPKMVSLMRPFAMRGQRY